MSLFLFVCDFGIKYQFLGVVSKRLSCVLKFTVVEPFAVDEFPDLCDELAGPFESRFLVSYVIEMCMLCMCELFRNEA